MPTAILVPVAAGSHAKRKGKIHHRTGHEGPEGECLYSPTLSLTSALDRGGSSTTRPGHFTFGKDPIPIVQEAGRAPGPVWTGAENLTVSGIRSPDRSVRNKSLYRLDYHGLRWVTIMHLIFLSMEMNIIKVF